MTLLAVENLTLAFEDTTVLDGVSFTIEPGELVALVGESGSGKSLTALSVMGLQPPESRIKGSIRFQNEEVVGVPERRLQRLRGRDIAMVFQEPMTALNPLHTIGRQLTESYVLHNHVTPSQVRKRQAELLDLVGLTHLEDRLDAYPHHLSGGERQRVMIAMAMANTPKLIICDEPTTALDVTLQQQVLRLLKKLQTEFKMSILLITHDLPVVRKVADCVLVMQHGKIVEEGPTKSLFANPQHAYTKQLIHALPACTITAVAKDAPVILETENLKVHFPIRSSFLRRTVGHVRAVDGVSLRIRKGETLGVVGESGSGKSSLGFALLRLGLSEGPITFLGERIDGRSSQSLKPLRKHLQIVFQDPFSSLNPRMTVGSIIAEGLRVHTPDMPRPEVRARVIAMLESVGLRPDMGERYPHEFSGGQRQRIAIARAMILDPEFVILDEPTSALDMSVQATILELLQKFQHERGVSYLLISHDLRVIRALSHHVMVMRAGRVVEEGSTEKLYERPESDYTRALLHAAFGEAL